MLNEQDVAVYVLSFENSCASLSIISLFPTELVCMLVRTMHEVREDMGPLVAMVMCSVPSEDPFTLIVQTRNGTAVGEQMNELSLGARSRLLFCMLVCA